MILERCAGIADQDWRHHVGGDDEQPYRSAGEAALECQQKDAWKKEKGDGQIALNGIEHDEPYQGPDEDKTFQSLAAGEHRPQRGAFDGEQRRNKHDESERVAAKPDPDGWPEMSLLNDVKIGRREHACQERRRTGGEKVERYQRLRARKIPIEPEVAHRKCNHQNFYDIKKRSDGRARKRIADSDVCTEIRRISHRKKSDPVTARMLQKRREHESVAQPDAGDAIAVPGKLKAEYRGYEDQCPQTQEVSGRWRFHAL